MPEAVDLADLGQFTGSETLYRHPVFRAFTYTEGVRYLAKQGGAYWLLDVVFSHQHSPAVRREPFQSWTLTVDLATRRAVVVGTDGGNHGRRPLEIARQEIEYTDFPLAEVRLYLEGSTLLLPSEH